MAVYKDKWNGYNGEKWRVAVYYKDWHGVRKSMTKGASIPRKKPRRMKEFIVKSTKNIQMGFETIS